LGAFDQLNSSMSLVRELLSAKEKLQVAELQVKLADVFSNLAEIKSQMVDLQAERDNLKQKLDGMDKSSELRRAFKIDPVEKFYILETETLDYQPGNFCSTCFDKDEKPIRLKPSGSGHSCNACKSEYYQAVTIQNMSHNRMMGSRDLSDY